MMSLRRWAATTVFMGLAALLLTVLTPELSDLPQLLRHPERALDTQGADAVALSVVGALAWVVWGWGALGLLLTGAAAAPGGVGAAARLALRALLPAGARRAAALALGFGLGVGAPLAAASPAWASAAAPTSAGDSSAIPAEVPDWPAASFPGEPTGGAPSTPAPATSVAGHREEGVPDWPAGAGGDHVVVRGDCLWDIAAAQLRGLRGREPTNGEIASAVEAWWAANATVIGPDPDLLLPGQVLRPPPR